MVYVTNSFAEDCHLIFPTDKDCLTAWEKVKRCSYLTSVILDSHVLHGVLDSGNTLDEFESVGLTSRAVIDRLGLICQKAVIWYVNTITAINSSRL